MAWQELPDDLLLDNPLWQYALSLWRHDHFAGHCLEAQSRGLAVTRILVALFCASRNQYTPEDEPADIRQWREAVTTDLRTLRIQLPKHITAANPLRETVKKAELEAEQVELAWWWRNLLDNESVTDPDLSRVGIARHNLDTLLPEFAPDLRASLVELWREIMEANGEQS
ncbi:MAG: DUF2390 domain-containing protein [Pseudomonadota bacterium]